ncbi:MAG: hypothetical protein AAGG47_14620, partial [Pseudomonadota bacterium]
MNEKPTVGKDRFDAVDGWLSPADTDTQDSESDEGEAVHSPWFAAPPLDEDETWEAVSVAGASVLGLGWAQNPQAAPDLTAEVIPWIAAEATLARPLAEAAAALGRLDEALLAQRPQVRAGLCQHLALLEISDLVWAEGERLRPETLALLDVARCGRTGADATGLGRA